MTDELTRCVYCDTVIFEYDVDEWLDANEIATCWDEITHRHTPLDSD